MRRLVLAFALLCVPACRPPASGYRLTNAPAWEGPVAVRAFPPPGLEPVAVVQASLQNTDIERLIGHFVGKTAELGGNIAVVDKIRARYDLVTRTETYSYQCGDTKNPRTCTGTRTVTTEVETLTMLGRAFRSPS
ncbi:MAG: hypothetical protein JNL79_10940 [Myxococcales bacterium]|nr:hypothetical protein [Myxococcales bacterium]